MDLTAAKGLLYCLLGLFVLVAWARERRKRRLSGEPEKFWPGTTYAPMAAYYAAAAGAILITIAEAAVEKRAGLTSMQAEIQAAILFQLLGAAVIEEALFRGLLQRPLLDALVGRGVREVTAVWVAITLVGLVFGLAHLAGGWAYACVAAVASLGYGWAYQRSGRIEVAVLTHFAVNLVHFSLLTYPMLR